MTKHEFLHRQFGSRNAKTLDQPQSPLRPMKEFLEQRHFTRRGTQKDVGQSRTADIGLRAHAIKIS
jgi:hypothetical protein